MLYRYIVYLFLLLLLASCNEKKEAGDNFIYNPNFIEITIPENYPPLRIPDNNPFTEEGIELGRKLFYDPIISSTGSFSCASCHLIQNAFTDPNRFSTSISGQVFSVNTMPLFNLGFYTRYSWNGKIPSIEDDVAITISELHGDWIGLTEDLAHENDYRRMFYEAFGQDSISQELIEKSLALFVRSIVSFDSRFDSIFAGISEPTLEEMRGFELFFTEEGDCFHCHIDPLFTNLGFHNNALDNEINMDKGFEKVTGSELDRGKFKVPSLRNLAFTSPYMHDGRFATLKDVINFYSEGLQASPYADSNMKNVHKGGIQISEEDKNALIAFLLTLTDYKLVSNQDLMAP